MRYQGIGPNPPASDVVKNPKVSKGFEIPTPTPTPKCISMFFSWKARSKNLPWTTHWLIYEISDSINLSKRICSLHVHHMFTMYSQYVHYKSTYFHYMFTICSLYVHGMFTIWLKSWSQKSTVNDSLVNLQGIKFSKFIISSLYIMFTIYSLYDNYMSRYIFIICSLYIHYMLTICSQYVHYMFTIWLKSWLQKSIINDSLVNLRGIKFN